MIHPSAIIHPSAKIDPSVEIGPYCIIGKNVILKKNNKLHYHVCIGENSSFEEGNEFFPFSAIGLEPQDKKYKKSDEVYLQVGSNNIFRENVTVNRGTLQDTNSKGITKIGNNNLLMAYVHIAHDCLLQDNIIMANNVSLAGHVTIQSNANLGGFCLVNQFRTIGQFVFVGMGCAINKNLIPFMTYSNASSSNSKSEIQLRSVNKIGMLRFNVNEEVINRLIPISKIIKGESPEMEAKKNHLKDLMASSPDFEELKIIVDFLNHPDSIKHGIYS